MRGWAADSSATRCAASGNCSGSFHSRRRSPKSMRGARTRRMSTRHYYQRGRLHVGAKLSHTYIAVRAVRRGALLAAGAAFFAVVGVPVVLRAAVLAVVLLVVRAVAVPVRGMAAAVVRLVGGGFAGAFLAAVVFFAAVVFLAAV